MVLPLNVSESEFASALDEFASVVGDEWVFSSDEDVALYRDSYSIFWDEEEERIASAALAPNSVEEVQEIVRIANNYGISLYPISTGRNLTYGGSAPTLTGSVVLDLKRMNRILEVDEKRHFMLVEPGASYFEIYKYIKENGLKVMLDVPDPGWGSPIGNSLDHGVGYTAGPYRDHFGAHCGMEVVTPEGDLIRTGMGAIPGSESWQDYHYGVGPSVDALFAQSNFGIVTKMGFQLMPMPEVHFQGTITVPRYRDLDALIEEVSYLEDMNLIGMPRYGSPLGGRPSPELLEMMQNGWPTINELEEYVTSKGLPAWRVTLHFYGSPETVAAGWETAKRRFSSAIPGAAFQDEELTSMPIPPEDEPALSGKPFFGIPALEIFQSMARNENNADDPPEGHADFFTIIPRKAEDVWAAARVISETYMELGFSPTMTPFSTPSSYYSRCFAMIIAVPTWREPERNERSRELFGKVIDNVFAQSWGTYRTNPSFQDKVVGKFSFNDNALLKFQEKLKDGIDPNGIISPGRYGIWPANMRNNRG